MAAAAQQAWEQALSAGQVQDNDQTKRAFFRERRAARSDISYLVNTLWVISGASILGFATMLALWPRARDAARRDHDASSPFHPQSPAS
ncbi:hypothetical protein J4558_19775 [Leptolyngbya sp. 15MV]|nr:hypothetical protein J4558_19775 [Leptolyngbya sp. 15MV]